MEVIVLASAGQMLVYTEDLSRGCWWFQLCTRYLLGHSFSKMLCTVYCATRAEQAAGQCNEHQKALLSKTRVGWTVWSPEPGRSSLCIWAFAEPWRSRAWLRPGWPAAMRCCLLAGAHICLGNQVRILKGVLSSSNPFWFTAARQSHSQMKLSQIQHHFASSSHHILPSTLNPPASYSASRSFCLDRRCMWPICPFSYVSHPVQRD